MSYHTEHAPPFPMEAADALRWNEGRRRRRLLSGTWGRDLEERLRDHFGVVRRLVMGPKSLAKNPFRKICHELAVNYDRPPIARHAERGDVPEMFGRAGVLRRVGLWPLLRRVQVDLIGLREVFLRPDWSATLGAPIVREVTPDVVLASADGSAPRVPVEIRELRWRELPDGRCRWAWDHLSVADPARPFFRIMEARLDGSDGDDLTDTALGGQFTGDAYPYRWTEGPRAGEPFLPYVLYHAMRKEDLFDPFEGMEVVDGALDVATAYTFLQHVIFRASWPQRWALNAFVAGTAPRQTQAGPRTEVPSDPTSLLHLEVAGSNTPAQIGQWGPGCDPEQLARTVAILERAVSDFDGLDSSHIVRDSSNPWSAAALAITREGKRQAQERYKPELEPADLETLEKLAAICNLEQATTTPLPESHYLIDYATLPLSADEAEQRRKHNAELIAQGRMSIVDAYVSEHPGSTRDEAIAALEQIAADNERFGVQAGTAPTPLIANPKPPAPQPAGA